MDMIVSNAEKKIFIEWLMNRFSMEHIDWFLEEIIDDDRLLEKLIFVERVSEYPKGIIISADNHLLTKFRFFKGKVMSLDVYTAYHELQLYQDELFYIQVDFPKKEINTLYRTVIEIEQYEKDKIIQDTEQLLEYLSVEGEIRILTRKVNDALDHRDEVAFLYYANCLNNVKKRIKERDSANI